MQRFSSHGLTFRYPAEWTVNDDSVDGDVSVTVQSPGSTFWTITLLPGSVSVDEALDSAVQAYQEDYPTADTYPRQRKAADGAEAVRQDVDFVCMELIAAATLTAFQKGNQTVLTVAQGADKRSGRTSGSARSDDLQRAR